jgi:hypothetical protein
MAESLQCRWNIWSLWLFEGKGEVLLSRNLGPIRFLGQAICLAAMVSGHMVARPKIAAHGLEEQYPVQNLRQTRKPYVSRAQD